MLCACAAFADEKRVNVLLICVDDLKPVLGCYGDPIAKTPQLDKLAARSLRFESAYCNQAVCSPSRNALMLGLRPQSLGIYDLATNFRKSRPDAVTMAQYFKAQGYRTEALGKIFHVGHGNTEDAASWSVPHYLLRAKGYADPKNDAPKPRVAHPGEEWKNARGAAFESADVPNETYADGQIAKEAVLRIEAAKARKEPFFLAVGFMKPHLPFVAPKRFWDLYDPQKLPMPERDLPPDGAPKYAPQAGGELRQYKGIPAGTTPIGKDLTRELIHGYYAATSYMDDCAGKVLDAIERNGLADDTIIILWGDHGWHLGDHGIWCKHTNYEQATRIPLLLCVPGKKPAVTKQLVETVDIYPTLAALAGLPAPRDIDGKSFASLLEQTSPSPRDHVIHVYPRGNLLGRAIRTERYRLVEWKKIGDDVGSAEYELYDYEKDPAESKNLAASQPEVVAKLKALLASHPEAKPQISARNQASARGQRAFVPKDRKAMFCQRDSNQDGKLTREEFLLNQPDPQAATKRFPLFDTDKDGSLTEDEFVKGGAVAKP